MIWTLRPYRHIVNRSMGTQPKQGRRTATESLILALSLVTCPTEQGPILFSSSSSTSPSLDRLVRQASDRCSSSVPSKCIGYGSASGFLSTSVQFRIDEV